MKNKLLKHTGAMLLLLACCLTSCIKEDYAAADKASVTMTFTTRVGANGESTLPSIEQMKTLRVIMVRQNPQEVVWNIKHTIPAGKGEDTFKFNDVRVAEGGEMFDFYAIANEASFSGNFDNPDLSTILETTLTQDANTLIGVDNNKYLPAAEKVNRQILAGTNQPIEIEMLRPVAKVQLTFKNTTEKEVTLTDVKIPGMVYSSAYLFYQGKAPAGAEFKGDVSFETNNVPGTVVVPAGNEANPGIATIVRYVYPSPNKTEAYKLLADWNGPREEVLKTADETEIKGVRRNQMLNMTVTLKSNNGLSLVCEPMPWDGKKTDYEISAAGNFELGKPNALIFEYGDNNEKKAYATVYSTEAGAADRQATFTLKMTAPEGVRWTAHLTNALDFEFVEDENHASTGIGAADAQEVTLIVRPTKTYDYSTRRETQLYVTIETNPDQKQIIDKDTSATELSIVQVSTQEGEEIWNKQQP